MRGVKRKNVRQSYLDGGDIRIYISLRGSGTDSWGAFSLLDTSIVLLFCSAARIHFHIALFYHYE